MLLRYFWRIIFGKSVDEILFDHQKVINNLRSAADRHNVKVAKLQKKITAHQQRALVNQNEADRAHRIASKFEDIIS